MIGIESALYALVLCGKIWNIDVNDVRQENFCEGVFLMLRPRAPPFQEFHF